jgi:hypothetical protein
VKEKGKKRRKRGKKEKKEREGKEKKEKRRGRKQAREDQERKAAARKNASHCSLPGSTWHPSQGLLQPLPSSNLSQVETRQATKYGGREQAVMKRLPRTPEYGI